MCNTSSDKYDEESACTRSERKYIVINDRIFCAPRKLYASRDYNNEKYVIYISFFKRFFFCRIFFLVYHFCTCLSMVLFTLEADVRAIKGNIIKSSSLPDEESKTEGKPGSLSMLTLPLHRVLLAIHFRLHGR